MDVTTYQANMNAYQCALLRYQKLSWADVELQVTVSLTPEAKETEQNNCLV